MDIIKTAKLYLTKRKRIQITVNKNKTMQIEGKPTAVGAENNANVCNGFETNGSIGKHAHVQLHTHLHYYLHFYECESCFCCCVMCIFS